MEEKRHIPVLLNETVNALCVKEGGIYVDGTVGFAGHSREILKGNILRLVAIDQDSDALSASRENLSQYKNVTFVHDNFKNIDRILDDLSIDFVDGILVDIGVSSFQIDSSERGFSFRFDSELDMRMNRDNAFSAYNLVNEYSEDDLARVIKDYGEEKFAKSIARHIVAARAKSPIRTTKQLEEIILSSVPRFRGQDGSSNVQRTFQAIRIEVNGELDALSAFIDRAVKRLKHGGRLAIISFHSLEDRIVKQKFKDLSTGCICPPRLLTCVCGHKQVAELITKHPITASEEELKLNPRSSSAKLRVLQKI